MPAEGMPEAVLSEPIVDNKQLKLGGTVAGPTDEGGISGAPVNVKLVGILKGPVWVAFTSKSFCTSQFLLNRYSPPIQAHKAFDLHTGIKENPLSNVHQGSSVLFLRRN